MRLLCTMVADALQGRRREMTHVSITCWSNDFNTECRELASFKDGDSVLDMEPAISKAISWLDDMLSAVRDFELIDELEKLRSELNKGKSPEPFPSYLSLPVEIVELMLKQFNLSIDVCEDSHKEGGVK